MLDIKFIRENINLVKDSIQKRGLKVDVDRLLELDKRRVKLIQEIDELRSKKKSSKKPSEKEIEEIKRVKKELEEKEKELRKIQKEYKALLFSVPNILDLEVPEGKEEKDSIPAKHWPKKVNSNKDLFDFTPKDHIQIAQDLDLIDFESGVKVVGPGFYYLKNEAVLLEMALVQYTLDIMIKEGFTPFITPELAKSDIVENMGFQPRGPEKQIYKVEETDLSLIATAEITLGGMHKGEILKEEDLPKKYTGFSSCFRVEAGAYGKYSKGLFRVHQFDKVEIFMFTKPEESKKYLEYITKISEKIYQGLKIPYRITDTCSGDMGAVAVRKFDVEAWMPGRGRNGEYGEVGSSSNCTDYQARNLNIRYKTKNGKNEYVHTLNNTALAISRGLISILENCQRKDGSVEIPKVLQKYIGIKEIKNK